MKITQHHCSGRPKPWRVPRWTTHPDPRNRAPPGHVSCLAAGPAVWHLCRSQWELQFLQSISRRIGANCYLGTTWNPRKFAAQNLDSQHGDTSGVPSPHRDIQPSSLKTSTKSRPRLAVQTPQKEVLGRFCSPFLVLQQWLWMYRVKQSIYACVDSMQCQAI